MMTFDEFHNGLRLLHSIDASELGNPDWWPDFTANPPAFLIHCSDENADLIWVAMEKRGAVKEINGWDREALDDLKRMIPDLYAICTRNPVNQVYFRAGLLACREYMARFVEQGGHPEIAQSIRANWWPVLGDDPGPPRLFDFDEICDESDGPDGKTKWTPKDISISLEALPRAYQFLLPPVLASA